MTAPNPTPDARPDAAGDQGLRDDHLDPTHARALLGLLVGGSCPIAAADWPMVDALRDRGFVTTWRIPFLGIDMWSLTRAGRKRAAEMNGWVGA